MAGHLQGPHRRSAERGTRPRCRISGRRHPGRHHTAPTASPGADNAVPLGTPVKVGDPDRGAEITVLKVAPVTPAAGEPWKAPGLRLVGIQFKVANIGATGVFDDRGPLNAQIVGADGADVERTIGPASIREGRVLTGYELRPG